MEHLKGAVEDREYHSHLEEAYNASVLYRKAIGKLSIEPAPTLCDEYFIAVLHQLRDDPIPNKEIEPNDPDAEEKHKANKQWFDTKSRIFLTCGNEENKRKLTANEDTKDPQANYNMDICPFIPKPQGCSAAGGKNRKKHNSTKQHKAVKYKK